MVQYNKIMGFKKEKSIENQKKHRSNKFSINQSMGDLFYSSPSIHNPIEFTKQENIPLNQISQLNHATIYQKEGEFTSGNNFGLKKKYREQEKHPQSLMKIEEINLKTEETN